jgi:hypothetical protein
MSEENKKHVDLRKAALHMHEYQANEFSEGSIAEASAYLNFYFKQACPKN